jgi:hypothetical protein
MHRHKLVEMRAQHLATNRGLQKQSGLWSAREWADFQARRESYSRVAGGRTVSAHLVAIEPAAGPAATAAASAQTGQDADAGQERAAASPPQHTDPACAEDPGLALHQGIQKKRSLWSGCGRAELEKLPLEGWTQQRRGDLLRWLAMRGEQIKGLDRAVAAVVGLNPQARLLMTQPGVVVRSLRWLLC